MKKLSLHLALRCHLRHILARDVVPPSTYQLINGWIKVIVDKLRRARAYHWLLNFNSLRKLSEQGISSIEGLKSLNRYLIELDEDLSEAEQRFKRPEHFKLVQHTNAILKRKVMEILQQSWQGVVDEKLEGVRKWILQHDGKNIKKDKFEGLTEWFGFEATFPKYGRCMVGTFFSTGTWQFYFESYYVKGGNGRGVTLDDAFQDYVKGIDRFRRIHGR